MTGPKVYAAIAAISQAFAARGIAKQQINLVDDYAYRSIDDVTERLAPLLGQHKLCILPRVLERQQARHRDPTGEVLVHVAIRVAFDLVSARDGSSHTIEAFGEALDHGDKATAKAMSSAYKQGMLHAFCVPVSGSEDPDQRSPRLVRSKAVPAPVEGWTQWAEDLTSVIASCMSSEAIDRLLTSNRAHLAGLAREAPQSYAAVGCVIGARRDELGHPVSSPALPRSAASVPKTAAARKVTPARPRSADTRLPRKVRTGPVVDLEVAEHG